VIQLIIKIAAYALLILGLYFAERSKGLLTTLHLVKGPTIAMFLICVYLTMIFFEIKAVIKSGHDYSFVKRRGFIFSVWIGALWGIMMSFAAGYHYEIDFILFFIMLLNWIVIGLMFGFLGKIITKKIWHYTQKKNNLA
jgi:hypothetical protein